MKKEKVVPSEELDEFGVPIVIDVPDDWFIEEYAPLSGMTFNWVYQEKKTFWSWLRSKFNF